MVKNFYYENSVRNYGIQSFSSVFYLLPQVVVTRWIFDYDDSLHIGLDNFDSILIVITIGLILLVLGPGITTFYNIRKGTSEVLKLK